MLRVFDQRGLPACTRIDYYDDPRYPERHGYTVSCGGGVATFPTFREAYKFARAHGREEERWRTMGFRPLMARECR